MSRLCLLLLALPGFALAESAPAPSAAERLGWTLAVHSYTFREFSILAAIDQTAALGVRHMSLSGTVNVPGAGGAFVKTPAADLPATFVDVITARMKQQGLAPGFVTLGVVKPGLDEAESRKLFATAQRLGIGLLVAEPETHGRMEELAPVMDVVEKLAVEYGIKVAIHNHPGPKNFYWHPATVAAAVKGRSPLLGACADVGHWVRSGLDPVACLRQLEGRVLALHFKDLNERGLEAHDVPWGTGVSNARGLLVELKRQGFHGAICVEYEYHWQDSAPEIAQSVAWFNRTCAELAAP
jgi:sugar phosphate isomerase/epimerase